MRMGREGAIRSHGTHAAPLAAPARLSGFERHSLFPHPLLPSHHSPPSPWLPPCLRTVYPPQMLALRAKPITSSKMMLQEEMWPFTPLTQMPPPRKMLLPLAMPETNYPVLFRPNPVRAVRVSPPFMCFLRHAELILFQSFLLIP